MAKHYIGARKKPLAEIKAAPTWYERTHPVGSAERFLDEAAKEALVAAAAGGVVTPRQAAVGAAKAVADETEKYPDPLLAEAAKLPKDELLKRAAKAEVFQKAMDAQNRAVAVITAVDSPVGRTATTLAAADAAEAVRQAAKGGDTRPVSKPAETFDTPIPKELRARYDAWYAQLPKNLQYTGDYDLQGTWLERLGQPDRYEAAQNGHLDDYGKKPNHITFSTGSKWHDPNVPERTGGEWRQANDGSWDFYPGTGNKASDDELKAYFDEYEKGNRVHRRGVRQDALGGDAGSGTVASGTPVSNAPQNPGGPRIVINPTTFRNKKDALCVAFNEGFRVWMEANDFQPQSEPTDAQRRFFSDTAYADDEVQLRRTILARIATFDTSVKDPTDEQLAETGSFLDEILESDWCKNDWERNAVSRLSQAVKASVGAEPVEPRQEPLEAREPEPLQANADMGGGITEDEDETPAQEPADDPGPADNGTGEGEGRTATSGDGTVVSYNADGTFAGETRTDGSYSLASGSGEGVNYNKDGTLQEPEQAGPSGAPSQQNMSQSPTQDTPQSPAQDAPAKESAGGKPATDWDRKLQAAGLHSGVFKTMADGSQRELTGTEAAALQRRIDSGASVSGRQLAMFGLSRDEQGRLVSAGAAGSADAGQPAGGGTPASPDAGLDREPQKPLPGRRTAARRRT